MPASEAPISEIASADLDWVAGCLALSPAPENTARLRLALWSDADARERVLEAAARLRLTPALVMRLRQRGLVPPAARRSEPGTRSLAEILDQQWGAHLRRRAEQSKALGAIVAVLNAYGLKPILLKGARSLWLDIDPWRTMRDLDLLVPGERAREANAILKREGYAPLAGAIERPHRHHFDLLFRDDLPGWVEVHRLAGNPYAEPFLPTQELAARSIAHVRPEGEARVLAAADHLWHGLIHHHFGHSAFARGVVDLKGLYEFAMGFDALSQMERGDLMALAARDAAGLAALDLWLAAAADALALPSDLAVATDAAATWAAIKARRGASRGCVKYPGYGEALALGWARERVARLRPRPRGGRLGALVAVVGRLAPKLRRG